MSTPTPLVTIVGGYGLVGTAIARRLLDRGAARVRIAGRDGAKAARLAVTLGCSSAAVDLSRPETWPAALEDAHLVLVCADQTDTGFVRAALSAGLLYVDISASDRFFQQVEALDELARRHAAAAVLSVGLVPGLSNLLVKQCAGKLDRAQAARIGVMLGLGDTHGQAAIAWMLDTMASPDAPPVRRSVVFREEGRAQPAYRFDFADQHVVRRTLGLSEAETLLALESPLLTRLAFSLGPHLHRRPELRRLLERMLTHIHIGSDRCALSVEVTGEAGGEPAVVQARFEGRREVELTACFAAVLIGQILRNGPSPGVHHSEQVAEEGEIVAALEAEGAAFAMTGPQPANSR